MGETSMEDVSMCISAYYVFPHCYRFLEWGADGPRISNTKRDTPLCWFDALDLAYVCKFVQFIPQIWHNFVVNVHQIGVLNQHGIELIYTTDLA